MGWFSDLEKALKVFREKKPELELFDSIESNIYGDFIIRTNKQVYIVIHASLEVCFFNKEKNCWEVL